MRRPGQPQPKNLAVPAIPAEGRNSCVATGRTDGHTRTAEKETLTEEPHPLVSNLSLAADPHGPRNQKKIAESGRRKNHLDHVNPEGRGDRRAPKLTLAEAQARARVTAGRLSGCSPSRQSRHDTMAHRQEHSVKS